MILINGRSIAQLTIPYLSEPIDASLKDTAYFSACRFPYSVSNILPGNSETVQWKVVKGTVSIMLETQANMQVRDIKGDTAILTYTIYNPDKVARFIDTLWLFKTNSLPCSIIDRSWPLPSVKCGDTITLYSKFPIGYNHRWTTTSTNAEIIDGATTGTLKVKLLTAGNFIINVNAFSANDYNTFFDSYALSVTCSAPTVTQAEAGPNQNLTPCQYPFTLSGNAPASGETVKWEVETGSAYIQNEDSKDLRILDISNGTRLKYTITRGDLTSIDYVSISTDSVLTDKCNPVISNTNPKCGDTISIDFSWNNQFQYILQWTTPDGLSLISQTSVSAKFKVSIGGPMTLLVLLKSNYNTFAKRISINATCPQTSLTKAKAGSDIYILPCQFPYTLSPESVPQLGETAKWEVVPGTGIAYLLNENSPKAILTDALNGTRLKYTITNGSQSSTDTLTVNILGTLCDPFISNRAPKCGDTVHIYFNNPSIASYTFKWEFSGITPYYTTDASAGLIMTKTGNYRINTTVISPHQLNTVTNTITLSSTCSSSVTQANAGEHYQTVTCNNPILQNANSPGPNEMGEWKLLTGNAVITEKNNPKTTITNVSSELLVLVWTISNGSASSSDTIRISVIPLKVTFVNIKNATCNESDGSVKLQIKYGTSFNVEPLYCQVTWENGSSDTIRRNLPSGSYYVSVVDRDGCKATDTVRISDNCNEVKRYSVEGNVYGGVNLYKNGLALLIKQNESFPVAVNSVHVKNGYYKFTGVEKGEYTVYVLPYKDSLLTILDDYFLPTYYVNKVSLTTANPIQVKGNTYSVDIKLAERKQSNIGPNNVKVNIDPKNGSPISTFPVLLFNEKNELVDAGFFDGTSVYFDNLASGKYFVAMAITNDGYKNSALFEVNNARIIVDAELKDGTVTSTEISIDNTIRAFPNPFKDQLTIEITNVTSECKARLIDPISVKEVKVFSVISGQNLVNMDDLAAGFYILQIENGGEVKNVSIIKQ
ncbi:MAG: T9SS type A sorting domain-containing protein [Sporocytophaga sp.]|nr:T9SS type A sorting domain-containing protein [Sporocytophaga sp.]